MTPTTEQASLCVYLGEYRPRWGLPGAVASQLKLCSCNFREKIIINGVPTTPLLFVSSPRVVAKLPAAGSGTSPARGSPWEHPGLAPLPFPLHGPRAASLIF